MLLAVGFALLLVDTLVDFELALMTQFDFHTFSHNLIHILIHIIQFTSIRTFHSSINFPPIVFRMEVSSSVAT